MIALPMAILTVRLASASAAMSSSLEGTGGATVGSHSQITSSTAPKASTKTYIRRTWLVFEMIEEEGSTQICQSRCKPVVVMLS